MIGKASAVGYTFLWSIAYGFIVSIVLVLVLSFLIPETISLNDSDSVARSSGMVIFATLAAAITQMWLVYGAAYGYGLSDGLETCALPKTPVSPITEPISVPIIEPTSVPVVEPTSVPVVEPKPVSVVEPSAPNKSDLNSFW